MTPLPSSLSIDPLELGEEHFLRQREKLVAQLASVDAVIATIRAERSKTRTGQGLESLPVVKPNEFRGMRAVDALENYLRARRGFKIPLSRIVADLVEGGVDPGHARGKKNDPAALVSHTLKIGIPNRKAFGYHPDTISEKTGAHVIPRQAMVDGHPVGPLKDEEITVWLGDAADQPKRRVRKG